MRRTKRQRRVSKARRIERHGERGALSPKRAQENCLVGGRCIDVLSITEIDQLDRIEMMEVEQE